MQDKDWSISLNSSLLAKKIPACSTKTWVDNLVAIPKTPEAYKSPVQNTSNQWQAPKVSI